MLSLTGKHFLFHETIKYKIHIFAAYYNNP